MVDTTRHDEGTIRGVYPAQLPADLLYSKSEQTLYQITQSLTCVIHLSKKYSR